PLRLRAEAHQRYFDGSTAFRIGKWPLTFLQLNRHMTEGKSTLGKWFRSTGRREEIFLSTKFGAKDLTENAENIWRQNSQPSYIKKRLGTSLALMDPNLEGTDETKRVRSESTGNGIDAPMALLLISDAAHLGLLVAAGERTHSIRSVNPGVMPLEPRHRSVHAALVGTPWGSGGTPPTNVPRLRDLYDETLDAAPRDLVVLKATILECATHGQILVDCLPVRGEPRRRGIRRQRQRKLHLGFYPFHGKRFDIGDATQDSSNTFVEGLSQLLVEEMEDMVRMKKTGSNLVMRGEQLELVRFEPGPRLPGSRLGRPHREAVLSTSNFRSPLFPLALKVTSTKIAPVELVRLEPCPVDADLCKHFQSGKQNDFGRAGGSIAFAFELRIEVRGKMQGWDYQWTANPRGVLG
ncbi:hypothetical protein C8F04DRAFT_1304706, partial [Mycena alexandri]